MTSRNLKFLLIFATFLIVKSHPVDLEPFENDDEFPNEYIQGFLDRIASGINTKTGEVNEFCYLSIRFYQKHQTCGCFLLDDRHVVTSARCLMETFTPMCVKKMQKFYIPDGTGELGLYDVSLEVPHTEFSPNNIALVKFSTPFNLTVKNPKVKSGVIGQDEDFDAMVKRLGGKFKFRTCGIGSINNKGQKSKSVLCTEMEILPNSQCQDNSITFTPPEGMLCMKSIYDNNACAGDFGGPVYAYEVDSKNKIIPKTQEIFCTLVGSPNVRSNANCQDGHITYCMFLNGRRVVGGNNVLSWLLSMSNPSSLENPPPNPYLQKLMAIYQALQVLYDDVLLILADPDHKLCYEDVLTDIDFTLNYIDSVLNAITTMDPAAAQSTVDDVTLMYEGALQGLTDCNNF